MPEPMGALNPHQPCEITGSSWDVGTAYCVAHDRGEVECELEALQREVEELRAEVGAAHRIIAAYEAGGVKDIGKFRKAIEATNEERREGGDGA